MFVVFRDPDDTWRVNTNLTGNEYGIDILCGMTLTEALLVIRYINGAVLTGQDAIQVADLIANNECPPDG